MIVDAQVHIWEADRPEFPWDPAVAGSDGVYARFRESFASRSFRAEDAIAAMDAVGVDAAILMPPIVYGHDASYCLAGARRYPERFRVVGRVDGSAPTVASTLARWKDRGMAGARVTTATGGELAALGAGRFDGLFAAAAELAMPVCVYAPGGLGVVLALARRFPSTAIVLDHMGLKQPGYFGTDDPWLDLPDLLALAGCGNVAVKLTGVTALASEPFPFPDLWPRLHRVLAAFGVERLLWGTDLTQHVAKLPYRAMLGYLSETGELSAAEKRLILGENLRRIFAWA